MVHIKQMHTGKLLYKSSAPNLRGINLRGAKLADAYMPGADLLFADLTGADLRGANLRHSHLTHTNLTDTNLEMACLEFTNLFETNLKNTNFSLVQMYNTVFCKCSNIYLAKNLEQVKHYGPSVIDPATLRACVKNLPDKFLQGVGYNREEVEYLRAMYAGGGIKYYSCFIAYRRDDYDFAKYLHDQLEAAGVTCWLDERDMQGGRYERPQIKAAIKAHDKLLLVCSEEMVERPRVVEEVIAALQAEREGAGRKLFPVRLDEYICSNEVLAVADEKLQKGDWTEDWIRAVKSYHIPDFHNWKDHDKFQEQFERLLRDLKSQPDD